MVSEKVRSKIIEWIRNGISYSVIMDKVKDLGESISKGGITYIKKDQVKKETEQTEQETEQETEQKPKKKQLTTPEIKKIQATYITGLELFEKKETEKLKKYSFPKLFTDIEFNIFYHSWKTIYSSNLNRYKSNKAHGMLNSLCVLNDLIEKIKLRGKYNDSVL